MSANSHQRWWILVILFLIGMAIVTEWARADTTQSSPGWSEIKTESLTDFKVTLALDDSPQALSFIIAALKTRCDEVGYQMDWTLFGGRWQGKGVPIMIYVCWLPGENA